VPCLLVLPDRIGKLAHPLPRPFENHEAISRSQIAWIVLGFELMRHERFHAGRTAATFRDFLVRFDEDLEPPLQNLKCYLLPIPA